MGSDRVALDAVICNEELRGRRRRPATAADRDAQRRALESLAQQISGSPRRVLQSLSDAAMELCRAHSAGISLVEEEDGRQIFRWHAVSGQWSCYLWNTLPREFSPCGTVLDRKAAQLMVLPERYFTPLAQVFPKVHEVLLIPFSVGEVIAGTVWVVAHDDTLRFDRRDRRVVTRLAKFAAVAYAGLASLSSDDVILLARLSKARALPRELPAKSIQRRVLIVDDNRDAADSLAAVLRQMGHEVHVAQDGRAGMQLSFRVRPHVVLLDIAMPGMNGIELGKEMRDGLGPQVRIVALTGFGSDEDRRQSLEAGFDQHLVKPVDPAFLKGLIG